MTCHPIATRQCACLINSTHTEILVQRHTDRLLILATQLGRPGSFYQASLPSLSTVPSAVPLPRRPHVPELQDMELPPVPPGLDVKRLVGTARSEKEVLMHHLVATELAGLVWSRVGRLKGDVEEEQEEHVEGFDGRHVVVGLGLKDWGEDESGWRVTLAQVLKMAMQCRLW